MWFRQPEKCRMLFWRCDCSQICFRFAEASKPVFRLLIGLLGSARRIVAQNQQIAIGNGAAVIHIIAIHLHRRLLNIFMRVMRQRHTQAHFCYYHDFIHADSFKVSG